MRFASSFVLLVVLFFVAATALNADDEESWEQKWLPPLPPVSHQLHCSIKQKEAYYYVWVSATSRDGLVIWGPRLYAGRDVRMKALEDCDEWMNRTVKEWRKLLKERQQK